MNLKELKQKYPCWLYITPIAPKQLKKAYDFVGGRESLKEHHSRIFDKYIDKYFSTWDNLAYCCNNDFGYSPVIFCLYAEQKGINPNSPLIVMRQVVELLTTEPTN